MRKVALALATLLLSGSALAATNGFGVAFHVGTAFALAGAAIAGLLLREPADPEPVRLPRAEEREHEALAA